MKYDMIFFTDNAVRFGHSRPMGAYRLATELRQHGYSVIVIDFTCKLMLNKKLFATMLDGLIGPNTFFVGFSGSYFGDYTTFDSETTFRMGVTYAPGMPIKQLPVAYDDFVMWAKFIKKRWSQVKLAYGGFQSANYKALPDEFDYVIQGYADTAIIDLVNHIKHGGPLKYNPLAGKKFKLLDYDKLGLSYNFAEGATYYDKSDHIVPGEVLTIETSRGCMFECKFCGFPLLGRKRTDPAYHRLESYMTEELRRNWEEFGVRKYIIADHTFNETSKKIESMIRARDAAKVDFEFVCFARVDLLDKEPQQIPLLKELGLKSPFFGIESFHAPAAKAIGKGTHPDKIKDLLYKLKDVFNKDDFSITGSFIVGLPHDTPDTVAKTMEWVMDPDSPIDSFGIQGLSIGGITQFSSDFSKNYAQHGYILDENGRWFNETWDELTCRKIATDYQVHGYNSGRLKLSNFELAGLVSHGYEFKDLCKIPAKDIPWNQIKDQLIDRYKLYINNLLEYEGIPYNGEI